MKRLDKMRAWRILTCIAFSTWLIQGLVAPANGSITPGSLEAELAPGESVSETKCVEIPSVPPKADIVFSFDLTESMSGIISTAKERAIDIMNALNSLGVDINYGVMSYMDYPGSYSSCGYFSTYGYASCGDYAYSLDQAVTSNTTNVSNAINGLSLGCGADGPQDYTRIFYESYADSSVGWRPGAKKILVNFGDNVPHDCNLNEGVTSGTWTTGADPGRDEVMGTTDDLDLQAVLAGMAANNVILLESHSSTYANEYWTYWTGLTGGSVFITDSSTLVDDVVAAVTATLTTPEVSNVHLEASSGFESWVDSSWSYSGPTGVTECSILIITVPAETECGEYCFTISALDDSGVSYGEQSVCITVPCIEPKKGRMTGGGSVFTTDGVRVTHAFELNCAASQGPNNLQVNWGKGNRFHLESLTSAFCSDDPTIEESPPVSGFDTYEGSGSGRYNGVSGATATWKFTDAGEPGKNDFAEINIWDAGGNLVLSVAGNLNRGNHQAHKD